MPWWLHGWEAAEKWGGGIAQIINLDMRLGKAEFLLMPCSIIKDKEEF